MVETPNTDYTEPPSITVIPNHQTDNPSESTPTNSTTDIPTALPDTNTTTQQPDIMNPAATGNVIIDGEGLMMVINKNLKDCVICKSNERKLVISSTCTLATNFKVTCFNCEKKI